LLFSIQKFIVIIAKVYKDYIQGVPDLPNARLMVDSWCNSKTNIPLPKCRGCCNFDVIKGKSSSISELNFPALRDFASKVPRASIDSIERVSHDCSRIFAHVYG